ncbi:hypothetical protein [Sphingomonas paucimobilis]|uniref:hypothetical protein n=1 Tax=Sphingomonas paucimobilis TaxID=13689 RepID=UPI00064BE380|nr:hypothetical protein [Sphingomonas paucimobilis]
MTASGFAMSESAYSWQMQPAVQQLRAEGRGPSFGAWCMILICRLSIERHRSSDDWTPERSDAVHSRLEPRLDAHGEPPPPFAQCWIRAQADTHQHFARKGVTQAKRADATAWLDALRALWRRYVPEEGRTNA